MAVLQTHLKTFGLHLAWALTNGSLLHLVLTCKFLFMKAISIVFPSYLSTYKHPPKVHSLTCYQYCFVCTEKVHYLLKTPNLFFKLCGLEVHFSVVLLGMLNICRVE